MNPADERERTDSGRGPQQQTDEQFGSIKGRQRGPDDFKGKSDTPRGSEPEIRGASGRRG